MHLLHILAIESPEMDTRERHRQFVFQPADDLRGDIYRVVGEGGAFFLKFAQQKPRFGGVTGAELDEIEVGAASGEQFSHFCRLLLHDLHFAAGRIIFGTGHDLLEELVAGFVVEIFGRQVLMLRA